MRCDRGHRNCNNNTITSHKMKHKTRQQQQQQQMLSTTTKHYFNNTTSLLNVAAAVVGLLCLALPLSSLSSVVVASSSTTTMSSGKARYKTMYACEDRQLTMDCDYGSRINLIRANYGRFSITQCNEHGQLDLKTDCMSPITCRIMRERCQDKQKCSVNATSTIFGDKCPNTRKYLEVHFQCQPDRLQQQQQPSSFQVSQHEPPEKVDLRNSSQLWAAQQPSHIITSSAAAAASSTSGASTVYLPPNNNLSSQPPRQQPSFIAAPQEEMIPNAPVQTQQQQQQPPQQYAVMNSDILDYNSAIASGNNISDNEQIIVTLRHSHTENMSNPRCVSWDSLNKQWTPRGGRIVDTNSTHTVCAFDQAASYLLVMDYHNPNNNNNNNNNPTVSSSDADHNAHYEWRAPPGGRQSNHTLTVQNLTQQPQISPLPSILPQQQQQQPQQQPSTATAAAVPLPEILPSYPQQQVPQPQSDRERGFLDNPPAVLFPQPQDGPMITGKMAAGSSSSSSSLVRFFSVFGYLLAIVFVAIAFVTIAFIASTMRSAGTTLKSLGNNFTAFGGPKYKNRHHHHQHRQDDGSNSSSNNNKDLLVINNQNGHQFLYAPASTTKINTSHLNHTTHILPGTLAGHHHHPSHHHHQASNTLHHHHLQQQQQMYSGNGTLSNLSGTGGQSNYYYGLMGSLFQQQQQQSQLHHHLSTHHLNAQHHHQIQQQQQANSQQLNQASANYQANKSTISNESSNSTPSSSGVESASTSLHQQQQPQSCLMMNSEYNLMGQQASSNHYNQHQSLLSNHLFQQPQLTLNAHYSSSGPLQQATGMGRQVISNNQLLREHIYESVDDDNNKQQQQLCMSRQGNSMLLPTEDQQQQQLFSSNTLSQQQNNNLQQANLNRAMTMSSRLLQNAIQQQQQQPINNQTSKRLTSQPAIVRDNQTKTNIICSKMAQVTPQRATEINNKFQHDIMAIFNGNETTTTTTTTTSGRPEFGANDLQAPPAAAAAGLNKVSTDC